MTGHDYRGLFVGDASLVADPCLQKNRIDQRPDIQRTNDFASVFGTAAEVFDQLIDLAFELQDRVKGLDAALRWLNYTYKEEFEPVGEIVLLANAHQVVVIEISVSFEKVG
jgi:hypothetical protein